MKQEKIQTIINKITNENKLRTSKLKKEIILFIEHENMSNSTAEP